MNFKEGQIDAVNTLRHDIPKTKKKTLQSIDKYSNC